MNWPLCGNDPDLGEMPAQAVEDLGTLPHQHLAHLVVHQHCLIIDGADLDEAHRGTRHRLADRRRISSIILLPFNVWLHIGWRHQPDVVSQCREFAAPVMG